MTEADDIDDVAAEYVLGTLNAGERAAVAARRQREATLDAAIVSWERRLAALSDVIPPVAPSPAMFARIEARLRAVSSDTNVIDMTRRMKFWRGIAIAASSVAATLLIAFGASQMAPKPKGKNLVAVLQKDAQSPAFLVSVNVDDRVMTIRPVAAKHEAGKSYELWIIHDSLGKPKSLGVIDDAEPTRAPTLVGYKPDVLEASTYAVTLEPEGGSPSGDPTGPIVFTGKMIETTDY